MNRPAVTLVIALAASGPFLALHGQENVKPRALVVGCNYEGMALDPLPSPLKDAERVAEALASPEIGFEVKTLLNPTREDLRAAVKEHCDSLAGAKRPGLFYFSGHGAQLNGENYLIPHRAELAFTEDLETQAFALSDLTTPLATSENGINLIFLDACRDNPLQPRARGKDLGRLPGLAEMNAPGLLIGFAADSGKVAFDYGDGSLYTNALLKHLKTPGISVTDLLTVVRKEVRRASDNRQEPFLYAGIDEIFTLAPVRLPKETGGLATPVPVTLTLDKVDYFTGEHPVIKVEVERDCHLGVFYKDAGGAITQLFPNNDLPDCQVRAGEPVQLLPRPNPKEPGKGFMLEVCPPYGEEHFIIVATEEPSGIDEVNARRIAEAVPGNATKSVDAPPYLPVTTSRGMNFINGLLPQTPEPAAPSGTAATAPERPVPATPATGPKPEALGRPETAAVSNSVTGTADDNNPLTASGDGAAILKIRTRPR